MTKICVFSDSHGYAGHMLQALDEERPDMVIHLGDGESDLRQVRRRFPDLEIHAVRGNCDLFSGAPELYRTTVEGRNLFAVHGHFYQVKMDRDYQRLRYAALEADAHIVLFGHTHIPYHDRVFGMEIVNPGSIGAGARPSYAVVIVDGETVRADLKAVQDLTRNYRA